MSTFQESLRFASLRRFVVLQPVGFRCEDRPTQVHPSAPPLEPGFVGYLASEQMIWRFSRIPQADEYHQVEATWTAVGVGSTSPKTGKFETFGSEASCQLERDCFLVKCELTACNCLSRERKSAST